MHMQDGVCVYLSKVVLALLSSVETEIKSCRGFARLWGNQHQIQLPRTALNQTAWMHVSSFSN